MMSKWGQPTPDKMHFPLKLVLKWNYRQCLFDTDILTLPQSQMKNKTYITNSDLNLVCQTTINKCSLIGEEPIIGALATHFLTSPWQQTGKLAQNVKHNPLKKHYVIQIETDSALLLCNRAFCVVWYMLLYFCWSFQQLFVLTSNKESFWCVNQYSTGLLRLSPRGPISPFWSHFYPSGATFTLFASFRIKAPHPSLSPPVLVSQP